MLFDVATQLGMADALSKAVQAHVTVASIGEVTSRALKDKGFTARIVPAQAKMRALAEAVGAHFARLI
jgi:uroporphyrinogen-III synthase